MKTIYTKRKYWFIYGVEKYVEDNNDGEKVLMKIVDELEINLQDDDMQSTC